VTAVKEGDHVRVVLEGVAHRVERGGSFDIDGGDRNSYGNYIKPSAVHVVSVEVLPPPEPPVVTFKPGQTVREKGHPKWVRTLAHTGYINHIYGRFFPYDQVLDASDFTSEKFELVEIG
jgi:hypothetical protein